MFSAAEDRIGQIYMRSNMFSELAKNSIGALLRGYPDVLLLVDKPLIDQMIEDVVSSKNDEIITAFRNEITNYSSEFSAGNTMPPFTAEICSQFFKIVGDLDFENSVEDWIKFLKNTICIVVSKQFVGRTLFLKMLYSAVEKELLNRIAFEGELLEVCCLAYKEKAVHNYKFEREALLDLSRLLVLRNKSDPTKIELIKHYMGNIAIEYAYNDLREGDYAEISQFLVDNIDFIPKNVCENLEKKLWGTSSLSTNAVNLLYVLENTGKIDKLSTSSREYSSRALDSLNVVRAQHGDANAFEDVLMNCYGNLDKFVQVLDVAPLFGDVVTSISAECLNRLNSVPEENKFRPLLFLACRRFCFDVEVLEGIIASNTDYFFQNSDDLRTFLETNQSILPLNTKKALDPLLRKALAVLTVPVNVEDYGYWDRFEMVDTALRCLQVIAASNSDLIDDYNTAAIGIAINKEISSYVRVSAISLLSLSNLQLLLTSFAQLIVDFELRPTLLTILAAHIPDLMEFGEKYYLQYQAAEDDGLLQPLNALFDALKLADSKVSHGNLPPKLPSKTIVSPTGEAVEATLRFMAKQLATDPSTVVGRDCHGD